MAQKHACGTMLEEKNKLIGELEKVCSFFCSFAFKRLFLAGLESQGRLLREDAAQVRRERQAARRAHERAGEKSSHVLRARAACDRRSVHQRATGTARQVQSGVDGQARRTASQRSTLLACLRQETAHCRARNNSRKLASIVTSRSSAICIACASNTPRSSTRSKRRWRIKCRSSSAKSKR